MTDTPIAPSRDISRLIEITARLRNPVGGCPWDLEQDFMSLRHYAVEEAYEVADAVERGNYDDMRDELGDLLLQPVFQAQMASEAGLFDFGDVVQAITEKLIRRHPHVFGEEAARKAGATTAGGVKAKWDEIKAGERIAKAEKQARPAALLDDVPIGLPSLARAEKLTKRAGTVGFDWPDAASVKAKVAEELQELESAATDAQRYEEMGDLLFAVANLARHHGIDPEAALRDANAKFTRRFGYVEERARQDGVPLAEAGLARLDGYWNEIRAADKAKG